MKRVLLVYTELLDYRIPIFKELGIRYDLTVTHAGKKKTNNDQGFKEVIIPTYSIWRFRYQPQILNMIRSEKFDAIIFFLILHGFRPCLALLFPHLNQNVSHGASG